MNALTRRQFVKRAGVATAGATVLASTTVAMATKQGEFDPADWMQRAEAAGILVFANMMKVQHGWYEIRSGHLNTDRWFGNNNEDIRLFQEICISSRQTALNKHRLNLWLIDNGYTLERQSKRT